MGDTMDDADFQYNLFMGDAKSIWGLYNTLYALIFYASLKGGKSMGDWGDFLGDASPQDGSFRILSGCGVTRHSPTILAKNFFSEVFWRKNHKFTFFAWC